MEPLKKYTLKELLSRSAEMFAGRPALSYVDGEPITYVELFQKVQEVSQFLRQQGIIAGDRVALLSENKPNWGVAFFAVTTMGAVVVPILPDFHPNEIHHILRHSESKALFVSERLYGKIEEGTFEKLETTILLDNFSLIPPAAKKETLQQLAAEGEKEPSTLRDVARRMTGKKPFKMRRDEISAAIYASSNGEVLQKQVEEIAWLLHTQGVTAGDRIAILSENTPTWNIAFFTITALGATPVPVPREFSREEVYRLLEQTACKAIFVSEQLYEKIAGGQFNTLTSVISIEDFQLIPLEKKRNKLKDLLEFSSREIEQLKAEFPQLQPEAAEEKLKTLLQQGNNELEKIQEEFVANQPTPIRDKFKELIEYSSRELEKFREELPQVKTDAAKEKFRDLLQYGGKELEKLKDAAMRMTARIPAEVQAEDLASIIYTSGTTGKSKGVVLTHKNIVTNAESAAKIVDYMHEGYERFLSLLPMSHTYECTIGFLVPILTGNCIYYLEKPPTARVLLPAMTKVKPTMMLAVPLIIEKIYKTRIVPQLNRNGFLRWLQQFPAVRKRLYKIAGKKLLETFGGELHFFGIGGAPLSPDTELFLREAGFPYAIGYGLTETSPLLAGCNARQTKYRSTGPAIAGVELRIDNPNPETGEGEIVAHGPNVMQGYYKAPELTTEVLTADGWFKTGDLGVFDQDGYLFIKGRLKNMILGPSGENIYPEEIEAVINESDYVAESLVFQQQDQLYARVHLDYEKLDQKFSGQKLSETEIQDQIKGLLEELRQSVNARVSSFARLNKMIEQPEPFEKTPTKKIKRYLYVS